MNCIRVMAMTTRERISAKEFLVLAILVLFFSSQSGCSGTRYIPTDRGPQAYYQTGYPVHDTSREIRRIFGSVKRINVTGYYETYIFSIEDRVRRSELTNNPEALNRAIDRINSDHSKAGTAAIISTSGNTVLLLTNQHVVHFPDTLIQYHTTDPSSERRAREDRFIESISFKRYQINLIYDLPELGSFEVIAQDRINDIALIGVRIQDRDERSRARAIPVRIGDPSKLVWGSFVYVLGYPKGYPMVTRGIVSDPNRDRHASFLLDALFNEGISGGVILAVRGDTGDLEWVGMARAGAATAEAVLVPDPREVDDHGFLFPYEGNVFLEMRQRLNYGITLPVPMTSVRRFIQRNHAHILRHGYSIPPAFLD